MKSQTPEYSDADFERVLAREFPVGISLVACRLFLISVSDVPHISILRVRLASLSLASGDLARLRDSVNAACGDPRDVLAWAEYGHAWNARDGAEKRAARKQDWEELQEWLARR